MQPFCRYGKYRNNPQHRPHASERRCGIVPAHCKERDWNEHHQSCEAVANPKIGSIEAPGKTETVSQEAQHGGLREHALVNPKDDLFQKHEADNQNDRRYINAAKVRHYTSDRTQGRFGDAVEKIRDLRNKLIARVHDLKGNEP